MAVPVQLASSASKPLPVGQPKPLFRVPMLDTFIVGRSYEVGNDGQRFLMPALASGATALVRSAFCGRKLQTAN